MMAGPPRGHYRWVQDGGMQAVIENNDDDDDGM